MSVLNGKLPYSIARVLFFASLLGATCCLVPKACDREKRRQFARHIERHVFFLAQQQCGTTNCLQSVSSIFSEYGKQSVLCCAEEIARSGDLSLLVSYWAKHGAHILADEQALRQFGLLLFSLYAVLVDDQREVLCARPGLVESEDPWGGGESVDNEIGDLHDSPGSVVSGVEETFFHAFTIKDVITFCIKLNAIQVERVFDLLDDVFNRYIKLTSAYKGLSWQEWVYQCWWVPVATVCILGLSFLRWKYGEKPGHGSSYRYYACNYLHNENRAELL
ncbi:MAG: hypothetical protein JW725_00405 [Candidatus Babeliaceae bacterium]|nr:hypothetical protein [Candidatus Babeliaceae bacterium]